MAAGELTDGYETTEARKLLAEYLIEHADTIANALGNQSRRMAEAADMADGQGQAAYAKVFRDDSTTAFKIMTELYDLLERFGESHQEDFANSGD